MTEKWQRAQVRMTRLPETSDAQWVGVQLELVDGDALDPTGSQSVRGR